MKNDENHDPLKGWELDLEEPKYKALRDRLKFIGLTSTAADMWARGMLVHKRTPQSYSMDTVSVSLIHSYMRSMGRKNQSVFVNEVIMRGLIALSLEESE